MEEQKSEHSFELRSEKVRNIVGEIPSSLLRYGMGIIGGVLLCVFSVAYYLPYKQVYSGVAIAQGEIGQRQTDSVEVFMLLRFEGKRLTVVGELHLSLYDGSQEIAHGQLLQLSSQRDTLERQEAICLLAAKDWALIEKHTVDFRITTSSGTFLSQMLGRWRPTP